MKKTYSLMLVGVMALLPVTRAATLTVTTTAASGAGSLDAAITALNDGDTIAFNIPGAGVKVIHPPVGGFQLIQKNNITIDGYTQPGSSPNTNPILAANNANIKIVLKAVDGEFTDLTALGIAGYNGSEGAILSVIGSTNFPSAANFTVRGLCFEGDWVDGVSTLSEYGIALGGDAVAVNPHVSGCRFGLDPDNTTVSRLKDGIAYFSGGGAGVQNLTVGVAAGPANAAAARAQFNIFIGMYISVIGDLGPVRLCGNFFNVYPDGLHDYNVNSGDGTLPNSMEAVFEFGGNNTAVIGTDGDGLNDAEERNIFGGATDAGDSRIMEWYGNSPTNTIIAGNYIGVGVDGTTRFTNGGLVMQLFETIKSANVCQFGSDFDGVSDDIEANLISWNYPFTTLYPDPANPNLSKKWRFGKIDNGASLSLRGNKLIGNSSLPYTYFPEGLAGDPTRLENYSNYVNTFMVPTGDYSTFVPFLATTNVYPTLSGGFSPGLAPYTNIIIDVYQLDPEGWANGQQFAFPELTDNSTYTNGFPQGKKYLGSFAVPNSGSFSVNISGLDLGPGAVTVTANYSANPIGTHRAKLITANFSNPGYVLPGGVSSVGVTQVVPDVACWFDTVANTVTNGFIKLANQPAAATLGNWEPFASAIGDSTFLVEFNTYANDGSFANQNNAVAKQPAAGGPAKVDYAYYADNGTPFKGALNLSRQNGNPGRVAGDLRYGANKFITEAEVSLGQLPEFQTVAPARWLNNNIYQAIARYTGEQIFTLDPTTLAQTPVTNAWDYVYGNTTIDMGASADTTQVGRTGGRPNFLDNGNIVVMIDDKAAIASTAGEVTTFAIIQPNGTIVKGPTLVDPRNIFDNMCAFKGGFCIRVHEFLYFYDNNGNPTHTNDVNRSSGVPFNGSVAGNDGDRGDAIRIGGDIRSYYVFFAGHYGNNNSCGVAAWDSRTGQFVGWSKVSDGDPDAERSDRTSVAVDALNRVCVTYMYKPDATFQWQAAARVAQFDGTTFNWQTHSFYPFVNHDQDPANVLGYTTLNPVVAMNPRQICIAAKGTINNLNSATAGPNSLTEQTVYTVISQPVPVAAPRPVITMTKTGGNLNLSWNPEDGLFTVQTRTSLTTGSWGNATAGNVAPPVSVPAGAGPLFVRLAR